MNEGMKILTELLEELKDIEFMYLQDADVVDNIVEKAELKISLLD